MSLLSVEMDFQSDIMMIPNLLKMEWIDVCFIIPRIIPGEIMFFTLDLNYMLPVACFVHQCITSFHS